MTTFFVICWNDLSKHLKRLIRNIDIRLMLCVNDFDFNHFACLHDFRVADAFSSAVIATLITPSKRFSNTR